MDDLREGLSLNLTRGVEYCLFAGHYLAAMIASLQLPPNPPSKSFIRVVKLATLRFFSAFSENRDLSEFLFIKMLRQISIFANLAFNRRIAVFWLLTASQLPIAASAQQRVRTTSPLPLQTFKRPEEYFFRLGPIDGQVTASTGILYTDNANLVNTGAISRTSFFQALDLTAIWELSQFNQLQINLGGRLTEDFYSKGKSQIYPSIAPDSLIQFQFSVGLVLVRLYDQISYIQDPTAQPTATNTTNLNLFTNTIGAQIGADLSLATVSVAADYTYSDQSGSNQSSNQSGNVQTSQSTSSNTGSRSTFHIGPTITFQLSSAILYGIEGNFSHSSGSGSTGVSTTVDNYAIGPFIRGHLTRLLELDLSAGLNYIDTSPSVAPTYYVTGALRYQANRNLQVIFTGSHDTLFTTGTDLTEETNFRLGTQYNLTRFTTLRCFPFLNFGNAKSGVIQGNYAQYGVEAGIDWRPRKRWTVSLSYSFIKRDADLSTDTYVENNVGLQVGYSF